MQRIVTEYKKKNSFPPWRIETVPISFNFCHIANEKVPITDIASDINYEWRERLKKKSFNLEKDFQYS